MSENLNESMNGQPTGFDPMTGQPVNGNAGEPQPTGFDPMTGQPVYGNASAPQPTGFDPMTGQPVYGNTSAPQPTGFDPMTGQPVYSSTGASAAVKAGASGIKLGWIIAGGVAAVVVVAGIVTTAILNSPKVVVPKAIVKTASDSGDFAEAVVPTVLTNSSYTASVDFSYTDYWDDTSKGNMELRVDGNDKQFYGDFDIESTDFDVLAEINKSEVKVAFPSLVDDVLVYNYTEEKDGDLEDLADIDYDDLDQAFSTLYNTSVGSSKDMEKDLTKMMKDFYADLDFEKVDKEDFEVNGKDRSCKGYEAKITSKDLKGLIEDYRDFYMEYYGDSLKDLDAEDDIDDMFDEMLDEVEDMPKIDITFYVYKGELAAIIAEAEGEEMEIDFKGGDYRLQNIEVLVEDETVCELEGEKDGSTESGTFSFDGEDDVMEWEYDTKSGDFEISIEDYSIEGTLLSSDSSYTLELDKMDFDDTTIEFSINIEKGAKFETIDGEEFDIGNADEDDLEDFVSDLADELGY